MKKKFGFEPFVLLTLPIEPDPTFVVPGSGQNGNDPFPMVYDTWVTSGFQMGYDANGDGAYDQDEYCTWWLACGFDEEDWVRVYGENAPPYLFQGSEPAP